MKKASLALLFLALLVVGLQGKASANPIIQAHLTGANEVNGGDPDGSGDATISLSPGGSELCFNIVVTGLAATTGAHIHRGVAGVNGPIVVALTAPVNGSSTGCVPVDSKLLKEIQQHPDQFYVNVHTTEYPGGAIRGQLSK